MKYLDMRNLNSGIIIFYVILAAALFFNHYGVAQTFAKYLFGIQVLAVLIYLMDLKLK